MDQQFKESLNTFNFKLLNAVCKKSGDAGDNVKTTDNVFYSPISISMALGMVLAGSDGNTRDQLMHALGLDVIGETSTLFTYFEKIIASFSSAKDDKSRIMANKMVIDHSFNVDNDYKSLITKNFDADVDRHSLASPSIVPIVNGWVKKETNGMIDNLINEPLSADAKLILLNAIYFKDDWVDKFDPRNTEQKKFTNIDGKQKMVNMMFKNERMKFLVNKELKYSMIDIPYKSKTRKADNTDDADDASMVIVLPKDVKGILSLLTSESAMKTINEDAVKTQKYRDKVNLHIPKFQLETSYNLNETLQRVGVIDLFDTSKCNLSKISSEPLYVSSAIHKAKVVVNEEGSEAAAVTGVMMKCLGFQKPKPPFDFNCDHPFMFMIKENGLILFTGIMFNM